MDMAVYHDILLANTSIDAASNAVSILVVHHVLPPIQTLSTQCESTVFSMHKETQHSGVLVL